jgi:hypothetical protein
VTLRRGTSLLDLLPQTTELAGVLPDDIVDRVGVLTVLDHRSMESEGVVFHRGTLQDPTDVLGVDTSQWVLNIPGVSTGLPFRLAVRRGQAGTGGNQEAGSTGWVLDILVEDAELRISQLRPAVLAGGQGTNPLHLEPSPGGGDVVLAFSGVVRVSGGGADGTKIEVVDDPDPFDPDAPAGAVIRLTARPPSFLFGSTQYGATLENLLVDLSRNFTPGDVMARGHGEDFEGLAYKSLSFYLPKSTPIVGSLSISTKDVIFGWSPLGVQGELALEFGKQFQNLVLGGVTFIPTGDPSHPLTVTNQGQNTTNLDVQLPSSATATTPASVDVQFSVPTNTIDGRKPTSVSWALSDGREGALLDLPGTITLSVRVNDVLKFRIEVTPTDPSDDTGPSKLAEVAVRFVAATGGPNSTPASKINVVLGNQTFKNATKVRGNPTALAGIRFETDPTDTKALWSVGAGVIKDASTERNAVFTPQLLPDPDGHPVKLQLQSNNHTRYLELEIKRNQAVLIGHRTDDGQGKVTRVPAGNITVDSPPKPTTYALAAFHATGDHGTTQQKAANPEVTITPGSTSFAVPPGILADVQVSGDTTTTGTPSASRDSTGAVKRGFAVFFSFAQSDPPIGAAPIDENATASNLDPDTHDQLARPLVAAQAGPDYNAIVSEALTKWLAQFPDPLPSGFQFLVVGRTDDLWLNAQTILDNASQNDGLAGERAQTVVDLLPSKVRPNALQATEQGSKAGFPSGAPTRIAFTGRLAVPSATLFSASAPFSKKGWSADGPSSSPQHATAVADAHRPPYRCVEIYAFDPNGTTPTPPSPTAPAVARMLVPGDDGDAATPPGTTTDQSPPTNYRLRLSTRRRTASGRSCCAGPTTSGPGPPRSPGRSRSRKGRWSTTAISSPGRSRSRRHWARWSTRPGSRPTTPVSIS